MDLCKRACPVLIVTLFLTGCAVAQIGRRTGITHRNADFASKYENGGLPGGNVAQRTFEINNSERQRSLLDILHKLRSKVIPPEQQRSYHGDTKQKKQRFLRSKAPDYFGEHEILKDMWPKFGKGWKELENDLMKQRSYHGDTKQRKQRFLRSKAPDYFGEHEILKDMWPKFGEGWKELENDLMNQRSYHGDTKQRKQRFLRSKAPDYFGEHEILKDMWPKFGKGLKELENGLMKRIYGYSREQRNKSYKGTDQRNTGKQRNYKGRKHHWERVIDQPAIKSQYYSGNGSIGPHSEDDIKALPSISTWIVGPVSSKNKVGSNSENSMKRKAPDNYGNNKSNIRGNKIFGRKPSDIILDPGFDLNSDDLLKNFGKLKNNLDKFKVQHPEFGSVPFKLQNPANLWTNSRKADNGDDDWRRQKMWPYKLYKTDSGFDIRPNGNRWETSYDMDKSGLGNKDDMSRKENIRKYSSILKKLNGKKYKTRGDARNYWSNGGNEINKLPIANTLFVDMSRSNNKKSQNTHHSPNRSSGKKFMEPENSWNDPGNINSSDGVGSESPGTADKAKLHGTQPESSLTDVDLETISQNHGPEQQGIPTPANNKSENATKPLSNINCAPILIDLSGFLSASGITGSMIPRLPLGTRRLSWSNQGMQWEEQFDNPNQGNGLNGQSVNNNPNNGRVNRNEWNEQASTQLSPGSRALILG